MKFRVTTLAILLSISLTPPVSAAPSLQDVRDKVRALQEEAAGAGEAAQQAQVEYDKLNKQLASVKQQAAAQAGNLQSVKILVNAGATTNMNNQRGLKPVELAKNFDRREIVKFLSEFRPG